ncbi:MAG: amino acid adenylation domain-containing protein [Oscillibacter sp.]|nr:amino acid adenylation domain-containing protein [Oscillibacter sp.]
MLFPLTKPQRQIYDIEKFYSGGVGQLCGGILLDSLVPEETLDHVADALRRLNDALRLRIVRTGEGPMQEAVPYVPEHPEIFRFSSRKELDDFAAAWTREPLDPDRPLCEIRLAYLPDRCGILVKLNHMLGDEWSFLLLASQTCALLRGEEPEHGSFLDAVLGEEQYFHGGRLAQDRTYALEQFREREEPVFISDRPDGSPKNARLSFSFDAEQAARIRERAAEWGDSPFILFLTAFAVTVSRLHMNAESFYLGTEVRNRRSAAEKVTAGMFANTAALPVTLDNRLSFQENASRMRKSVTAMLRHQRFNYELTRQAVREVYGYEGKLFDAVLSYQNGAVRSAENAETLWFTGGAQSEALFLRIADHDDRGTFCLYYDYQTDKFTAEEIAALHERMERVLFDGIAHGERLLPELALLSGEERRTLDRLNNTAAEYDKGACVHTLFERQAALQRSAPALTDRDGTLTYGQLNDLANCAARSLIAQGIGPGDFVAFSLPRDRRLLAALLGILKAGAAYLPIDPEFPKERVDYMLWESRAKAYLTAENIDSLFSVKNGNTAESAIIAENTKPAESIKTTENTGNPQMMVSPESPCYAIYTSGSTGVPKGALMSHRGLVDLMSVNRFNPVPARMAEGDVRRVVSVGTVIFDLFGAETLMPLSMGLETLLADEESSRSQRELDALLSQTPAQAMLVTPTKLKSLMVDPARCGYLREMKMIVLGGEAVEPDLVEKLSRLTDAELYNVYGPAEAMWSTSGRIAGPNDITIGGPLANTQIHIVDRFLQPLPVGVTGEICVTGDVVGPGYLHNPERTAERFLPNPFGEGTLYRTGDLGRWRSDGRIDFLGRNDFQVKLKGIRMEPGEIELAIRTMPGVQEAAVGVRPDSQGRQALCAWYTGAVLSPGFLRRALGLRLPRTMIPQMYTHMDGFPLTASGKLDRRALPDPDSSLSSPNSVPYAPPEGKTEAVICAAMERVLDCGKIGRDDDFFDRGGDSLRLLELLTLMEQSGRPVRLSTLLENTTPRSLALAVENDSQNEKTAELLSVK